MKICSSCCLAKDISCFSKRRLNKDGLQGRCKECIAARARSTFLKSRDRINQLRKERRKNNKEHYRNKRKYYYQKYREEIDELYKKYVEDYSMIHWLPQDETKEEAQITLTIRKVYSQLFSLIHHRSDAHNELNYPLHVSLYDVTRAFGGYEEGGWWYDKYELIDSIEIHNPSQRIPAAEELYSKIGKNMDGKPDICIEKEKGSQEKAPPTWS